MQRGGNGLGWSIAAEHMALQHAGVLIIGYEGKVPVGEQDPTATIKPKPWEGGEGKTLVMVPKKGRQTETNVDFAWNVGAVFLSLP